ncbi:MULTISPECIES: hypothetical protein [Bacteria]|uniref:hypothetical protein n=1 Tax=Bacteria TaxID=2 RepID=UPI001D060DE4|nr:hypothetical protein [Gordonibacter urolithinfaciens]MCB7085775.1 hypothetical protein [Gordonibacter urolithinfaciens]
MAKTNGIEKLRNVMEHWHTGSLVDWCRGIAYQIEREHQDALNERIETICELNREIDQLRADLAEAKRENIVALCKPCRAKRDAAADWVEQQGGLDVVRDYPKMDEFVASLANDLGVSDDIGCGDDLRLAISEELDKRLMPNGMNWPPKDGDGEDLHIGDKAHFLRTEYDGDHEWDDVITAFRHQGIEGEGDIWIVEGEHGEAFACECMVKRPDPEVLGADGLPIKVGETVYALQGEDPLIVSGYDGEFLKIKSGGLLRADYATHTPPDTQERIDMDSWRSPVSYARDVLEHEDWDVLTERQAFRLMLTDLMRRQRELDAKTMGGDAS